MLPDRSAGLLSRRNALRILALAYPLGLAMGREVREPGRASLSAETLRELLPSLGVASRDRLLRVLQDSSLRGQIPAREVEYILAADHMAVDDMMVQLLPVAQVYSYSPLSHYRVGVVLRATSGGLYLGTNIEIPGQSLGFAVHGEQCAVTNAFMHYEKGVTSIAITAAPCGHCRQFLNELPNGPDLKVIVKGHPPTRLVSLLPESFGPSDLGVTERLFSGKKLALELTTKGSDELCSAALDAAARSYAPYTKAHSGVALMSSTNSIYKGSYLENAAYNPSLSPLQAALAGLIMAGEEPVNVSAVVLVEEDKAPISQRSVTRTVLETIVPSASLRVLSARLK